MIEFKRGSYGYIALKDLAYAEELVSSIPQLSASSSQQAVEKMCKQYLREVKLCTDESILHSHNFRRLTQAVDIPALKPFMGDILLLSDVYYNTRYPGEEFWEVSSEEASHLFLTATTVVTLLLEAIEAFRKGE